MFSFALVGMTVPVAGAVRKRRLFRAILLDNTKIWLKITDLGALAKKVLSDINMHKECVK